MLGFNSLKRFGGLALKLSAGGALSAYTAYALALDFDDAEYWAGGTQAASLAAMAGYTYTRTGTQGAIDSDGTVAWFAENVPAINGNGYHAYGAATNEALQSQTFDSATWSKFQTTVAANSVVAPDGTTTADTVVETAIANVHQIYQRVAKAASAITYTTTVFLKAAGRDFATVTANDGASSTVRQWFNLSAGTVGTVTVSGTYTHTASYIQSCGNGWYRCTIIFTTNTGTILDCYIDLASADNVISYAGDGTSGVYAWQHQVLQGSYSNGGPLIATAGATAAIGAGALVLNDAPVDADQLFWATVDVDAFGAGNDYLATWGEATAANYIVLGLQGNLATAQVVSNSVAALNQQVAQTAPGLFTIVARRIGGNWRGGVIKDGVLSWLGASTAGAFPLAAMNKLYVGKDITSAELDRPLQGVFRKLGTFTADADVLAAVA